MALAERGLETGGMKCSIWRKAQREMCREMGTSGELFLQISGSKTKREGKRETSTTWKLTLRVLKSCFPRIAMRRKSKMLSLHEED